MQVQRPKGRHLTARTAAGGRAEARPHHRSAHWVSPNGLGLHFARRPISRIEVQKGRTLIPAPKAHTDARRPCVLPKTQFGNPSTPIGSQGPFQAGGQAPTIHRVTKSRQGEFNGIPGTDPGMPQD